MDNASARENRALPSKPTNEGSSPSNPSVASASAAGPADAQGKDENSGNAFAPGTSGPSLPPVALPSGGGAIRGMGENVKVNAVQGAATVSIPIPASKARRNAAPKLSLDYSSGGGMGPWGIGWSLTGVPDVTRSTRKGLPTYDNEKDVFVLSGAEDLVPVFKRDDQGNAVRSTGTGLANAANATYELQEGRQDTILVREYRPRIDGIYNRIERWTDPLDPEDVHWRAFTPQNDMMVFGRDSNSRIMSGSVDGSGDNRIFSWLCCEAYDCYGNAILYQYKEEDAANVDLSQAHEKNRTAADRGRQRYLKRVKYGNSLPIRTVGSVSDPKVKWMFELVFDFGEHDLYDPQAAESPGLTWECRENPISSFQSGFEARTYRLCKRVLMFHHFTELGKDDYLTKALELGYDKGPAITYLSSTSLAGFVLRKPDDPSQGIPGPYFVQRLPPLKLEYAKTQTEDQLQHLAVQEFSPDDESMNNVPIGLQGSTQCVDLLGEGINGLLTSSGGAWYYKRNLSAANFTASNGASGTLDDTTVDIKVAKFGPLESVTSGPASSTDTQPKLMDLTGDGRVSFVLQQRPVAGFYRHTTDVPCTAPFCNDLFEPFRPFESWLTQTTDDPNLRFIDLTGDGKADILITQDDVLTWYESLGERGFAPARSEYLAATEELGPRVLFSDPQETIQLADFNGDGLPDIVRIRNGEICFWPNMGYGRFGAKVVMDNAPVFDSDDAFTPRRLLMGDIDGSGTTDLIYFHPTGAKLYFNFAGNAWAPAIQLDSLLPYYGSLTTVTAIDLLGSGTMCLVWSSSHPEDLGRRSMRYVDLTSGQKPHLLSKLVNNLGKETRLLYLPSTTYYLQDLEAGNPWATRLQYPHYCLDRIITYDKVSRVTLYQRYRYRHGYYDGVEREFRGFGMVEQWDTEEFDALGSLPPSANVDTATYTPPVYTKTWFHTGAFTDHELLSRAYAREYYGAPNSSTAGVSAFDDFFTTRLRDQIEANQSDGSSEELRQASRALKGSLLRSEVYVDDGSPVSGVPYQIQDVGNSVRMLQPRGQNPYAVFQVYAREQMTHDMERDPTDPKTKHSIKLEVDDYGNDVQSLDIWYGRKGDEVIAEFTDEDRKKQKEIKISYTNNQYTNPVLEPDDYRIPLICEKSRYELPGSIPVDKFLARYTTAQFANLGDYQEVPFDSSPTGNQKRLLERVETIYRKNNLKDNSKFGEMESLALPGTQHTLCLTKSMVSSISQKISSGPDAAVPFLEKGGYVNLKDDGSWWIPAAQIFYSEDLALDELSDAKASFFSPRRMLDEFYVPTVLRWDPHFLSCLEIEDQVIHNLTKGVLDYRTLQLKQVIDINSNIKEVAFDALGMVAGLVVRGKDGEAVGDTLEGFRANMTEDEIHKFLQNPDSLTRTLLAGASTCFIYNVNFSSTDSQDFPASVSTITRTQHHHSQVSPSDSIIELSISYIDGYHRLIQKKEKAEPLASTPNEPRWRGSRWTVLNNKGLPVQVFDPFFDHTHEYQFDRREGVGSFHVYDGLGREVTVISPNKTWTKIVEGSWHNAAWDTNDTVQAELQKDEDVGYLVQKVPLDVFGPSWYDQRKNGQLGPQEQAAATKTLAHASTPTTTYIDVMGRPILVVKDNASYGKIATRTTYDIDGYVLEIRDALGKVAALSEFSMTGGVLKTENADSGERWQLTTTRGEPMLSWDSRGNRLRREYDALRRQVELHWQTDGKEILVHKSVYGENQPDDQAHNLRGKLFREHDQAGVVTRPEWDFKGNELLVERQFASNYKTDLDWTGTNDLEPDIYPTHSSYDAKNRTIAVTSPDGSVLQKSFNQGGFLQSVTGMLKGDTHKTTFLASCKYDEYGRAVVAVTGNGTTTTNTFDRVTQKLANRTVLRQQSGKDSIVQNFTYTYDPEGNITYIQNDAEQTIFFRNGAVDPHYEYAYDAVYRVIEASGREHVGQTKGAANGPGTSLSASSALPAASAGDSSAMVKYTEQYEYDSADNISVLHHELHDAKFPGWTRRFSYETKGGLTISNRLVSTSVGNATENYTYDENGNMQSMPHLSDIAWDYKNQLRRSSQQVRTNGIPETTWYLYDDKGQRVRKVTERQSDSGSPGGPKKLKERLTIDGFEIYRKYGGDGIQVVQQCETLQIREGHTIRELVENWSSTEESGGLNFRLIRFEFHDQVGSINLELDEEGNLVSYEEFSPYGSTSYHSLIGEAPKGFRFAGKERDDESGLYYFGLRYYCPWLGRWMNPDPIGIAGGLNVFEYVHCNPVRYLDRNGTQGENENDANGTGATSSSNSNGNIPISASLLATSSTLTTTAPLAPILHSSSGAGSHGTNQTASAAASSSAPVTEFDMELANAQQHQRAAERRLRSAERITDAIRRAIRSRRWRLLPESYQQNFITMEDAREEALRQEGLERNLMISARDRALMHFGDFGPDVSRIISEYIQESSIPRRITTRTGLSEAIRRLSHLPTNGKGSQKRSSR